MNFLQSVIVSKDKLQNLDRIIIMKIVAPLLALCIVAPNIAQASFDLMLMPQLNGRVNRHDPVNNIALGTFGGTASRLVTHDSVTKDSFVYDNNNRIRRFNTSSGDLIGTSIAISGFSQMEYYSDTSKLLLCSTAGVVSHTLGALSVASIFNAGVNTTRAFSVTNNTAYIVSTNPGNTQIIIDRFNLLTNTLLPTSIYGAVTTNARFGKAAIYDVFGSADRKLVFTNLNSGGAIQLMSINLQGSTNFAPAALATQALTGFSFTNVMPSATAGHEGFFLTGQDTVGLNTTRIDQWDNSNSVVRYNTWNVTTGNTFSVGDYQTSNIVAPEPGSLLVIGAGLVALAKRRKAKS